MATVWDLPPNMRDKVRLSTANDCWVWIGAKYTRGYGMLRKPGKPNNGRKGSGQELAHRYSYETVVAPIPAGYHIDHLCRNHACVNPDHLEAVTPRVNILRGIGPTAMNARKTHCVRGHEFTAENTQFNPKGGRRCRTCIAAAKVEVA